ncbi:MAG: hypothetical protein JWM91_4021 [Rhodospirillales bacterium]|nr:hypothetical protein [Rhodospirillales bacterium]
MGLIEGLRDQAHATGHDARRSRSPEASQGSRGGLRETIVLRDKFARELAARDARPPGEAAQISVPKHPPADADMRMLQPAARQPAMYRAKFEDRGLPNG